MPTIVYYSTFSENTHRFVDHLSPREKIRLGEDGFAAVTSPYVLILPTLSGGRDRIPSPVIKFLNREENRDLCIGVIGSGDRNFGKFFCRAAEAVAEKLQVPLLYKFELFGTQVDVGAVEKILSCLES